MICLWSRARFHWTFHPIFIVLIEVFVRTRLHEHILGIMLVTRYFFLVECHRIIVAITFYIRILYGMGKFTLDGYRDRLLGSAVCHSHLLPLTFSGEMILQ